MTNLSETLAKKLEERKAADGAVSSDLPGTVTPAPENPSVFVDNGTPNPLNPLNSQNAVAVPVVTPPVAAKPSDPVAVDQAEFAITTPVQDELEIGPRIRTFKHPNAGSCVIMKDGTRLRFVGHIGSAGFISTNNQQEVEYLEELARQPGTMVTHEEEPTAHLVQGTDDRGRDPLAASRANSALEADPDIQRARDNLGQTLARN